MDHALGLEATVHLVFEFTVIDEGTYDLLNEFELLVLGARL